MSRVSRDLRLARHGRDTQETRIMRVTRVIQMVRIIDIANQKGGVGKTTTSLNVLGGLADRGHDVLGVDADPQGGLTLKVGLHEQYEYYEGHKQAPRSELHDHYRGGEYALYDVLGDFGELTTDDLGDLIIDAPEFDLVPAHIRNFRLEKDLYSQARGVEMLRLSLDRLDRDYDFVIIDSPPNLGPLADGALIASERVLFPSEPNTISRSSLELLFDEIETLEDRFAEERNGEMVKKYDIATLGAVLNEVPSHGSVAASIGEWFAATFGDDYVFEIPDWDAVEHAIGSGCSVYAYDPDNAGYPWDAGKTDHLRERYGRIVEYLEGVQ